MIYEKILALCREKHLSIAQLEREVGLGNATIRTWGKSDPGVMKLKKIADYFGITVDALISSDEVECTGVCVQ